MNDVSKRKPADQTTAASGAKPRLWVVTEVYYPENVSSGYYLTAIAEGMTDTFDVKVLCGQPNYAARGIKAPKHEFHKGVEIFRAGSTTLDKNILFFRLLNIFTLSISTFAKSLRHFAKGDRVLVVTTPPSLPFVTALAALLRGSSYTLLIHDSYPEVLVAAQKFDERSLTVGLAHFLNRWLFKYAARIIVVGRDMHELLERKIAGLDIPIVTIPNWAELETVEPAPRSGNKLLAGLNIEHKFVFMCAGNIGRPNDIETIVECAERLRDDERFHFVFLGSGAKQGCLKDEAASRKLGNVSVLPARPRGEQTLFLNACDVAIVSLVDKMLGAAMPCRTYNILAAGKPILALTEDTSELARVIDEENVGWHLPPHRPEELERVIKRIYKQRDVLAEMGDRARSTAITKYSSAIALAKYREALN